MIFSKYLTTELGTSQRDWHSGQSEGTFNLHTQRLQGVAFIFRVNSRLCFVLL